MNIIKNTLSTNVVQIFDNLTLKLKEETMGLFDTKFHDEIMKNIEDNGRVYSEFISLLRF